MNTEEEVKAIPATDIFHSFKAHILALATVLPIGGRGVGNWEGDRPNFGRGGVVFGPPGGEQVVPF